jgi:hypothetical protein
MTAIELYNRVASTLRAMPLPGLTPADVDRFLERYQKQLVALIQAQFDERCRLGRLVPDFQENVGLVKAGKLDLGPTSRTWAAQLGNSTAKLAVKARCHPGNPDLREYAVHLDSDKLGRWLMFPEETWVWSPEESLHRFVENHFTQMRWQERDSEDGAWEGPADAPIQLMSDLAISIASGWDYTQPLTEEDQAEIEWARQERWEKHYRTWSAGKRNRSTPAARGDAGLGSAFPNGHNRVREPASASSPSSPPGERTDHASSVAEASTSTPWGGQRGSRLSPEEVKEGMRVVTVEGYHGTVVKATQLASIVIGPRVTHERQTRTVFDVRLDSGRTELGQREFYAEVARPTAVVPDVSFDGGRTWLEPLVAWRDVNREFDRIAYCQEKASHARKAANIREYERQGREAREAFARKFSAFRLWRQNHPDAPLGEPTPDRRMTDPVTASREFSLLTYRIMELESGADAPRWPGELRLLKTIPRDYLTRFNAGDHVFAYTADPHGQWSHTRHRIERIEDEEAVLDDGRRTPLYYLRLDSSASVELPVYTESQYVVDLGSAMLTDSGSRYPARGAVAKAVKEFLARHGIDVRTHVISGSMVTGIDLNPASGRWSAHKVSRMNALLGNLGARSDGASFEPWQREGREATPYDDYAPKGPGLVIEPEHIPTFAPILAAAMKGAGQSLNRVGEAWLARTRGHDASSPSAAMPGSVRPRGGATEDQRYTAAEGCREDAFDLPGYGHIRVVCGQAGRRDTWNNVYVAGRRYGSNGVRWARGEVPPPAVLQAIRERGITAFSTLERLEEPRDDDLQLDPVIALAVENGGLRADLVRDIAPELQAKAWAIPGFLRPDGRSWLELARAHYGPDIPVVEGSPSLEEWSRTGAEGTDGYIELVHWGLEYSFPAIPEDDEVLEYLCSCERSARADTHTEQLRAAP